MSKKRRRRRTLPPTQAKSAQEVDATSSLVPNPSNEPDFVPQTESGPGMISEQDEVYLTSQSGKTNHPKGFKGKSNIPHWRREQLRAAGRARGEQLKRDKEHQRKAGKARAASGDMSELAAKGNAKANEKDPNHQSNARRGKKKKSKPGNNGKTIGNGQAVDVTRNDEISEDKAPHKFEEATGEEEQ